MFAHAADRTGVHVFDAAASQPSRLRVAEPGEGRRRHRGFGPVLLRPAQRRLIQTSPRAPSHTTPDRLALAAILRRYRRALKVAHLDETHRFHDLRHTFGTRMAAAGVPMRTLQEFMGHRDIETTQRYSDYAPSAREAEMVAAAFAREPASAPVTAETR
jgi:integrase